ISVVGDDIANVSTVGYKASRAEFDDLIGGTAANGQRLGQGVRMGGTQTLFGQGSLQETGRPLDLAVRGNGFFIVSGPHAGDPANPATTSDDSTSMTVYGSLGAAHRVDAYFVNTGVGTFDWHAMVDGGDLAGGTPGTPSEIAAGTLTFTTDGKLQDQTTTSS